MTYMVPVTPAVVFPYGYGADPDEFEADGNKEGDAAATLASTELIAKAQPENIVEDKESKFERAKSNDSSRLCY